MKTTKEHFEIFKKECRKYIDKFELNNWEVHFVLEDDHKNRASLSTDLSNYIATAFLSKEWKNYNRITSENVKTVAKHEIIHLLLARLDIVAGTRFVTSDEKEEANEELVRKLEKIIQ